MFLAASTLGVDPPTTAWWKSAGHRRRSESCRCNVYGLRRMIEMFLNDELSQVYARHLIEGIYVRLLELRDLAREAGMM